MSYKAHVVAAVSIAMGIIAPATSAFFVSPPSTFIHPPPSALNAALLEEESTSISDPMGRRSMLINLGGLSALSCAFGIALPAFADVSDGNALPEGAAQFSRVIRAKEDLITISKRVSDGASEMDKTEWNNVGGFLRKIYAVGEDMKSIASGLDSEKKKKAIVLVDEVKKLSKAADAPTGSGNGPEFLTYSKKLVSVFDEFLDLLSDVPDEL